MIVDFYLNTKFIEQKNIVEIPNRQDFVSMHGQLFTVIARELDFNEQYEKYNIYLKRVVGGKKI